MPFTVRNATRLYWKLEGSEDRPALVLLNSIGTDSSLWDATVPYLLPSLRLLRIDTRGHGASDAPAEDYSLALLADDVAAIMTDAGLESAAVAGVSLGGMIAMELALKHPHRVSALALVCTSGQMDKDAWQARIDQVQRQGSAAIADMAVARFLAPSFARRHPEIADSLKRGIAAQADPGYIGAAAAIRDMQLLGRINAITAPSLVVTGSQDVSTPFLGHGDALVSGIAGARHIELNTAHLPPIEAPAALAAALQKQLNPRPELEHASDTLFEAGLEHRRRVLGEAWVERSLARRSPFTAEFQAMITRIAWQEIWSRPGLDERIRRLLVLAITASLGRWEEFALHVRSGLAQGGFSRDELKETLMQTAIYAGVPAANTAFATAEEILREIDSGAA